MAPHHADSKTGLNALPRGPGESRPTSEKDKMLTNVLEAPATGTAKSVFPEISGQLEKDLVQVFKLLADETRLKILFMLVRERELHVSALCERLEQSQPAVSHHLALLRTAGLISARRDGKHNFYSVEKSKFHEIVDQLFHSITEGTEESEVRFDNFVLSQS